MQGSDRIKTEFVVTFVCELRDGQGGNGWTSMGLAHSLNSGDWLGDLSELTWEPWWYMLSGWSVQGLEYGFDVLFLGRNIG